MTHTRDHFVELLYAALQAPAGIALRTTDVARARASLREARRKLRDPGLEILSFRRVSDPNELWIVKAKQACLHEHATFDGSGAYCPDCGAKGTFPGMDA